MLISVKEITKIHHCVVLTNAKISRFQFHLFVSVFFLTFVLYTKVKILLLFT